MRGIRETILAFPPCRHEPRALTLEAPNALVLGLSYQSLQAWQVVVIVGECGGRRVVGIRWLTTRPQVDASGRRLFWGRRGGEFIKTEVLVHKKSDALIRLFAQSITRFLTFLALEFLVLRVLFLRPCLGNGGLDSDFDRLHTMRLHKGCVFDTLEKIRVLLNRLPRS